MRSALAIDAGPSPASGNGPRAPPQAVVTSNRIAAAIVFICDLLSCWQPRPSQGPFRTGERVLLRRGCSGYIRDRMIAPRKSSLEQTALFAEMSGRLARVLPTIGEQSDIRYVGTTVGTLLNGPETTGMGYWSMNPYTGCAFGCAYCYARYAHRYAMERAVTSDRLEDGTLEDVTKMPPWLAFERRIFVKRNAADVLRRTLRYGSARHLALVEGESVMIGTATDPYQPAERKFRITRSILEVLAEHPGMSVVIITKSPLVTRDIDLLSIYARQSTITYYLSLIPLDIQL